MGTIRRTAVVWLALALVAAGAEAQEPDAAQEAYFRAVAEFFDVPSFELEILRDWSLPPDEIPVILFIADRAGVVPEALVALRRSGESWARLAERYGVGAPELHVPVPDQAATGPLTSVYQSFRDLPARPGGHRGSGQLALALADSGRIARGGSFASGLHGLVRAAIRRVDPIAERSVHGARPLRASLHLRRAFGR